MKAVLLLTAIFFAGCSAIQLSREAAGIEIVNIIANFLGYSD